MCDPELDQDHQCIYVQWRSWLVCEMCGGISESTEVPRQDAPPSSP